MTANLVFQRIGETIARFGFLFVLGGLAFGEDASRSPTDAERKAAAALTQRGATLGIDGEFHVVSASFASNVTLSDEDLTNLAVFKQLGSLTLFRWNATEAAIARIGEWKQLRRLMLPADAKPEVVDQLKKALPECRVGQGPMISYNGAGGRSSTRDRTTTTGVSFGPRDRFLESALAVESQLELQITDEQFARLLKLDTERAQWIREATGSIRGSPTPGERNSRDVQQAFTQAEESVREKTQTEIGKILNAEQFARLKQVALQRQGPTALREKLLASELKLSDEQLTKINGIYNESSRASFGAARSARGNTPPGSPRPAVESPPTQSDKILAVLTPEQRHEWDKRIGPPSKSLAAYPLEATAHAIFRFLDRDANGQLTLAEWTRSRNVRQAFVTAGVDLGSPMPHDTFRDHYLRVYGKRGEPKDP